MENTTDSGLGILGSASMLAALGLAGKHGFDTLSDMRTSGVNSGNVNIRSNAGMKPTSVSANLAALGLDKITLPQARDVSLADIRSDKVKLKNVTPAILEEIQKITANLTGHKFTVGVTAIGESATGINFNFDKGMSLSAAVMDQGGVIQRAHSGGGNMVKSFVPQTFLPHQTTYDITHNMLNDRPIRKMIADTGMSFGQAQLRVLSDRLAGYNNTPASYSELSEIFRSNKTDFGKFILHTSDYSQSSFAAQRHMASMLPIYMREGRMYEFDAYDKQNIAKPYATNLVNALSDTGEPRDVANLTMGLSKDNVAASRFINPLTPLDIAGDIYGLTGETRGDHSLTQLLNNKTARWVNPETMYSDELQRITGGVTEQIPGQTGYRGVRATDVSLSAVDAVYVPANDPITNYLLSKGTHSEGMPMARMGEEAFLAPELLLKDKIHVRKSLSIPLDQSTHYTENFEKLVNNLVTFHTSKGAPQTEIAANKSIQANMAIFDQLVEKNQIGEVIREYSDGFNPRSRTGRPAGLNVADFFGTGGKVDMFYNQAGSGRLGESSAGMKNAFEYLTNITKDDAGYRLWEDVNFTFGDTSGKFWGSVKALATHQSGNKDIAASTLALHEVLKGIPEPSDVDISRALQTPEYAEKFSQYQKSMSERTAITTHPIRGTAYDEAIINLTNKETQAAQLANPDRPYAEGFDPKQAGMHRLIMSPDASSSFYGVDMNRPVSVNAIMANRLKSQGLTAGAKYVEQTYDIQGWNKMQDTMAPLFNLSEKHHVPIDMSLLEGDNKSINALFGGDIDLARKTAMELTGKKNVSEKTKFYIRTSRDATISKKIPIPLFDSGYTLAVNPTYHVQEAEGTLLSQFNRAAKGVTMAESKGDFDLSRSRYKSLQSIAADITYTHGNYTNVLHKDARSVIYRSQGILSDTAISDMLDQGDISKQKLSGILQEHGLQYGEIDRTTAHGYSTERYRSVQGRAAEGGVTGSIMEILGRDPGGAGEAFTGSLAVDAQRLERDILQAKGYTSKQITSQMGSKYTNSEMYMTLAGKAKTASDEDKDILKAVTVADKDAQLAFQKEVKESDDFLSDLYGKKGSLKGMGTNDAQQAKDIIELYRGEKRNIAPIYNKLQRYTMPFNDMTNVLKDTADMSKHRKATMLNHFLLGLTEGAIGGKNKDTESIAQLLENVLTPSNDNFTAREGMIKDMINTQNMVPEGSKELGAWTFKEGDFKGNNILDFFEEGEIGKVLKQGDEIDSIVNKALINNIIAPGEVRSFNQFIQSSGFKNLSNPDSILQAYSRSRPPISVVSTSLNTMGEIAENMVQSVKKSRGAQIALGGIVLAGAMLRSPSSHNASQDVREESRPKRKYPSGANAIDAPSGLVNTPRQQGYRLSVRGSSPSGMSAREVRGGMSGQGFAVNNTVIDRSNGVDSEYVKDLQRDEQYNKWNG